MAVVMSDAVDVVMAILQVSAWGRPRRRRTAATRAADGTVQLTRARTGARCSDRNSRASAFAASRSCAHTSTTSRTRNAVLTGHAYALDLARAVRRRVRWLGSPDAPRSPSAGPDDGRVHTDVVHGEGQ